jgi:ribokinase
LPGARRRAQAYLAVVAPRARLTVFGSLNIDISVTVPELPVPGATVLGGAATFAPGGKGANQAVAAARLGAEANVQVSMVGCVGDDEFGRTLKATLNREGVHDQSVRIAPEAPTGIAMITVDQAGENIITVAPGANREVGAEDVAALGEPGELPNVLVISAEIPVPAILAALMGTNADRRPLTLVNLAPAPPKHDALAILEGRPDWLVVNASEAAAILGRSVSGLADAASAASDLVAAGACNAVVTAGAAGAAYHATIGTEISARTVPSFAVQARDTVGAGDTFVGALAVALASGIDPAEAITAASAAAATAATRPGTQTGMPRPADIRAATGYEWPVTSPNSDKTHPTTQKG